MKPWVFVAIVILSLMGIASAASLFVKSDNTRSGDTTKQPIEIRWGEGS